MMRTTILMRPGLTRPFLAQAALTLAALASLSGTPALAQRTDRVLTIFGNDKCPTNSSGEEIIVCVKRPEAERFRIPKEFRTPTTITPGNQSWAERAASIDSVGRTGADSCSAVGSQGWTGCWAQQMRRARAERKADAAGEVPTP